MSNDTCGFTGGASAGSRPPHGASAVRGAAAGRGCGPGGVRGAPVVVRSREAPRRSPAGGAQRPPARAQDSHRARRGGRAGPPRREAARAPRSRSTPPVAPPCVRRCASPRCGDPVGGTCTGCRPGRCVRRSARWWARSPRSVGSSRSDRLEVGVGDDEPLRTRAGEVDVDPGMGAVAFQAEDDPFAELAVADPLPEREGRAAIGREPARCGLPRRRSRPRPTLRRRRGGPVTPHRPPGSSGGSRGACPRPARRGFSRRNREGLGKDSWRCSRRLSAFVR